MEQIEALFAANPSLLPLMDFLGQQAIDKIGLEAAEGPGGEELFKAAFAEAWHAHRAREERFQRDAEFQSAVIGVQFERAQIALGLKEAA